MANNDRDNIVSKQVTLNEEEKIDKLRTYWLGGLADDDRCAFEAAIFDTEGDSELLAAVRDDLIQDYLAGELDDNELKGFQTNLLGQLNFVEEVALTGAINRVLEHAKIDETGTALEDIGWFDQIMIGFRQYLSGAPAAAFAALFVVFLIGSIVVWRSVPSKSPDVAMIQPPEINQGVSNVAVANVDITNQDEPSQIVQPERSNSPPGRRRSTPTKNVHTQTLDKSSRQGSYVALILGSATRGAQKIPEIAIPPEKENLRLIFPRPYLPNSYIKYSAKIVAADNGRVIGPSFLPDLSKKKAGEDVPVTFPKQGFVPGKYKLVVVGKPSNADPEVLSEREFRIVNP